MLVCVSQENLSWGDGSGPRGPATHLRYWLGILGFCLHSVPAPDDVGVSKHLEDLTCSTCHCVSACKVNKSELIEILSQDVLCFSYVCIAYLTSSANIHWVEADFPHDSDLWF